MAEPTILLEGRGIDKFFGKGRQRRQVLFGVDITVYAGECLAVIGGSGSGKTTLTRVLLGLEDADAGDIRYRGEVLRKQTVKSLRSQSGLVFQNPFDSLDPRWRVAKSVMEPLRLCHHDWSPEQISAHVDDAFLRVSSIRQYTGTAFPWTYPEAGTTCRDRPRHCRPSDRVAC